MVLYDIKGRKINKETGFRDLEYGIHRGKLLSNFLRTFIKNTNKKTILDLGSGKGGLSIAFAENFKQVESIDIKPSNVETIQTRAKIRKIKNLKARIGNALNIPLKNNSVDILMNVGVIEWVGCGNKKLTPYQCQLKAISEMYRVLKPGGYAITGTENRFFPYFWIREPHNHSFLLGLLPFRLANFFYQLFKNKKYYHRLLFYQEVNKLFKRFRENPVYVGIPNYQYTKEIVNINKKKDIIEAANNILKSKNLSFKLKLNTHWIKLFSYLRLIKLFTPNIIIVSRK